jgi:hypothetical protein
VRSHQSLVDEREQVSAVRARRVVHADKRGVGGRLVELEECNVGSMNPVARVRCLYEPPAVIVMVVIARVSW